MWTGRLRYFGFGLLLLGLVGALLLTWLLFSLLASGIVGCLIAISLVLAVAHLGRDTADQSGEPQGPWRQPG